CRRAQQDPRVPHVTVRESATEALEGEPCTARGIGEIGRDPLAAAGAYAPAAKLDVLAEHAVSFELRELRAAEHRTCARGGQGAESALIEPLAGASRAQQPLDQQRVVHAAAQDPGASERRPLIDARR